MKTVISIVLILVGIVGIYFVSQSGGNPAPVEVRVDPVVEQPKVRDERISVAVAKRDLAGKTVLTLDDFTTRDISVPERSPEKAQFSIAGLGSLENWALSAPVEEDSNIPVSFLVKPGTPEYISMFLQPGSVIYTFTIPPSDYYIFDNLKVGEYVDIYLAYDRNPASGDVSSPGNRPNITDMRLKPIMANKRVLSILPSLAASKKKQTNTNQNVIDGDDSVVVELTDHDVKILKTLERAKFVVFPSVPTEVSEERMRARQALIDNPELEQNFGGVLSNNELNNFPISNEELFAGSTTIKRIQG